MFLWKSPNSIVPDRADPAIVQMSVPKRGVVVSARVSGDPRRQEVHPYRMRRAPRTEEEPNNVVIGAKVPEHVKKEIKDLAERYGHPTVSSFLRDVFEKIILDERNRDPPRKELTADSSADDNKLGKKSW